MPKVGRIKPSDSEGLSLEQKQAGQSFDLSSPNYFLPFFAYLETARNTSKGSPLITYMDLPKGQIFKVTVEFPKGCAGLTGLQVWRGARQIFPLPMDTWLRSDNAILQFSFTEEVRTNPFSVEIRSYNLDDTYTHTPWIGFEMRGLFSQQNERVTDLINFLGGG